MTDTRTTDTGFAQPQRQVLLGLALLVVGAVAAVLLVQGDATTLAGAGYALGIAGLVLIGSGVVQHRAASHPTLADRGQDGPAVAALVLAVLLPPLGVLVGAFAGVSSRRGQSLATAAMVVGTLLTVALTGLLIAAGADARS